MTNFSLKIEIDNKGVETIGDAGLSVALLEADYQSKYQVVAVLTAPTNNIYIDWTDSVSAYCSSQHLEAYADLNINSSAAAVSGGIYAFNGSLISYSGASGLSDAVQLKNSSGNTVTAGLAKTFEVNQQGQPSAITTASSLLNNGLGTFQISNTVMLTLLGDAQEGMVIPTKVVPSFPARSINMIGPTGITAQPPLILKFTDGNASQTAHFDDQANVFVAGALPS